MTKRASSGTRAKARRGSTARLREEPPPCVTAGRPSALLVDQVKQKDRVGRPDIDAFETAMRRSRRDKGFVVAFDCTDDAMREIDRFFKEDHAVIVPLTVREILDEQIARKLV